jgi:hypothetical protein
MSLWQRFGSRNVKTPEQIEKEKQKKEFEADALRRKNEALAKSIAQKSEWHKLEVQRTELEHQKKQLDWETSRRKKLLEGSKKVESGLIGFAKKEYKAYSKPRHRRRHHKRRKAYHTARYI